MVPIVSGVKVMRGGLHGESYNWRGGRMSKVQFMFNLILPVPDTDVQISTSVKRSQSIFQCLRIIVFLKMKLESVYTNCTLVYISVYIVCITAL